LPRFQTVSRQRDAPQPVDPFLRSWIGRTVKSLDEPAHLDAAVGRCNCRSRAGFGDQLFRRFDFGAIISYRMVLRHRMGPPRGLAAVLLLGLPGAAAVARPPAASAQAIGTMQVTALVSPAPAAWSTLGATAELAAAADTAAGSLRLQRGLARLELEPGARDPRHLRIRVDYLRN
jgi:hypothetical protein